MLRDLVEGEELVAEEDQRVDLGLVLDPAMALVAV